MNAHCALHSDHSKKVPAWCSVLGLLRAPARTSAHLCSNLWLLAAEEKIQKCLISGSDNIGKLY